MPRQLFDVGSCVWYKGHVFCGSDAVRVRRFLVTGGYCRFHEHSRSYRKKIAPRVSGIAVQGILLAILLAVVLLAAVIYVLWNARIESYNVTAQYDLRNFITAEETYFAYHQYYLGTKGDFIERNNPASTLILPGATFIESEGVRIEVISGDGRNFKGPPEFIVEAVHTHSEKVYLYNFARMSSAERVK
ncbi:MAG: hypothetical protein NT072_08130 [Deltaproteobacteria bacterium]|nr:hypothetical protein [Deltaproteobacteria bacterium]